MRTDATALTLGQLSRALDDGSVSARDALEQTFARIEAHDGALGCYLHVDKEGARAAADASDARRKAGSALGPLDGAPIGLKDNFVTEGVATTASSKILEGFVSPYDGTAVRKLKDAGAVLVGKLNCDEFAMGSSNEHSAYGLVKNPWDQDRAPGGSSGGSAAAVAAGLCAGALGTDTGGSIRQPASFCGVAGLKPSYGRVSRFGVVAFASSLDQVGPFARDVEGCAHLLNALAGKDDRDATSLDAAVPDYAAALDGRCDGLTVGVLELDDDSVIDDDIKQATLDAKAALEARGATVKTVRIPHMKYAVATYYIVATAEASSNLARYDGVRYGPRRGESLGLDEMISATRGELFGSEVKRRIMLGSYVLSAGYYDAYYLKAQKVRSKLAADYAAAFDDVDVILSPTAPSAAFKLGEKTSDPLAMYLSDILTIGVNLAGLCGMSVNAGFNDAGLPLGVQLCAKPLAEETLLKAAFALEQERGLLEKRPTL